MSQTISRDERTFDVDVACGPVRTLHVKDRVSLVVFTTVVPDHPPRPTDLPEGVLSNPEGVDPEGVDGNIHTNGHM